MPESANRLKASLKFRTCKIVQAFVRCRATESDVSPAWKRLQRPDGVPERRNGAGSRDVSTAPGRSRPAESMQSCSWAKYEGILGFAVLGVLTELSSIAAVLERRSAGSAIGRAWRLMRERAGPLALIWLITVAVGMMLGTFAAVPILAVVIPFLFPRIVAGDPSLGLCALAGFFLVLAGRVAFGITSWLMAYSTSLWTLAFRSLTGGAP